MLSITKWQYENGVFLTPVKFFYGQGRPAGMPAARARKKRPGLPPRPWVVLCNDADSLGRIGGAPGDLERIAVAGLLGPGVAPEGGLERAVGPTGLQEGRQALGDLAGGVPADADDALVPGRVAPMVKEGCCPGRCAGSGGPWPGCCRPGRRRPGGRSASPGTRLCCATRHGGGKGAMAPGVLRRVAPAGDATASLAGSRSAVGPFPAPDAVFGLFAGAGVIAGIVIPGADVPARAIVVGEVVYSPMSRSRNSISGTPEK